jgi:RND family efflux transporter MFP subunit
MSWRQLAKWALAAALVGVVAWKVGRANWLPKAESSARAAMPARSEGIHADGRLVAYPGAEVMVGTELGGRLKGLRADEMQHVQKGDILAEIDTAEQRAALGEARARVDEAEADIKFLRLEKDRTARLVATNALADSLLDRSTHDLDLARAHREAAVATASRLATVVGKATITAPIDGTVFERYAEQGEIVAAGARLVRLIDLSRTRVEAEIDEYDVARLRLGQPVTISADGMSTRWSGAIEEIPNEVTSRRLKPEDPGRPSDVRVLLVKIAPKESLPVKVGQRVEVLVDAP